MTRIFVMALLGGCLVPKKDYDALQAELDATKSAMQSGFDERDGRIEDLEQAIASWEAKVGQLEGEIQGLQTERDRLLAEKSALLKDQASLQASVTEMEQALQELSARKAAADARIAEFKSLLDRFKSLIDAGKLRVKIVDGRMVVELATDILFASGSASLSKEGKQSIIEVAQVLATIPDRSFQVEGHTDNVPIATAQFPSNWHLAAARALTVTQAMVEGGLPANRVSAASFADSRPVASNDTKEGQAANRRIEIAVVPDLSSLPGFDELQNLEEGPTKAPARTGTGTKRPEGPR